MNKECCETNPDHSKQLNRINRIIGQLEGVKRMISEKRYCPDILVQTKAITSAVHSLEASILEAHLGSCVKDAMNSSDEALVDQKVSELLEIYKSRR